MKTCKNCKLEIYTPDQDLYNELFRDVDYYGMECLNEDQQLLVQQIICESCYEKENNQ
jgi:hypothetical protein